VSDIEKRGSSRPRIVTKSSNPDIIRDARRGKEATNPAADISAPVEDIRTGPSRARPAKLPKPPKRARSSRAKANGANGKADAGGDGGDEDPDPESSTDFRPTFRFQPEFDPLRPSLSKKFKQDQDATSKAGALRLVKAAEAAGVKIRVGPVSVSSGKPGVKLENWTNDPDEIESWNWPDRNVGVALGEKGGLVVVRAESDAAIKDLPSTFTVRGPLARYFWYRAPAGEDVWGCELAEGVRCLGFGQFGLADPFESFEQGKTLGWSEIEDDQPVAELPAWIIARARRRGSVATAIGYCERGWAVLKLPPRSKGLKVKDWQNLGITHPDAAAKHFKPQDNIGVILGAKSNGLTDIDLDSQEAAQLAPEFLPVTDAVFGREGKPRSHWLYYTNLHETEGGAYGSYDDPNRKGEAAHLLEIRTGGGGKGAQTVFPGSVHHTDEPVEWDKNGDPAKVDGAALKRSVGKLAAAVLLVRAWPAEGEGTRHNKAAALTGFLTRCAGWDTPEVKHFMGVVAKAAGDDEWKDRVRTTPPADIDTPIAGRQKLKEAFGDDIAKKLQQWLCTESEAERSDDDPRLKEMLDTYPLVKVGNKMCFVVWDKVRLYEGEGGEHEVPDYMDEKNFRLLHRDKYISYTGPNGAERKVFLVDQFIEKAKRKSLVFDPGAGDTENRYNLWRGFGVQPRPGQWPRMQEHIHDILANGNDAHAEYIRKWTAWAFQNPGRAAKVVLAFCGGKQTGKGTFAEALLQIFGAHGWHTHGAEALTGEFNAHLAQCSLMFWDEVIWGGDKKGEQRFKGLVTDPTLEIRPLYVGKFKVRNCLHIVAASNNEWIFPASHDEARAAVFAINNKFAGTGVPGKTAYFDALRAEMRSGGLAAMLHDLQALDLEGWCPWHDVPGTDTLREQKLLSMPPIDKLVFNLLEAGELPCAHPDFSNVAFTSIIKHFGNEPNLYEYFKTIVGVRSSTPTDPGSVSRKLQAEWKCKGWKRRYRGANSGFARGVEFPPYLEMRANFESKYGKQTWSHPDQKDWSDQPVTKTDAGEVVPIGKRRGSEY
jgi:hypothetical protein